MKTMTARTPVWLALAVIAAAASAAPSGPTGAASAAAPNADTPPVETPLPAQPVSAALAPPAASAQQVVRAAQAPNAQPQNTQTPGAQTSAVPTPDVQGGTQTLHALYDAARNYDAPYRAASAQVRASQAVVGEVRARLLPQIGLQADIQGNRLNAHAKEPIAVGLDAFGQPIVGQSIGRSYAQNDVGLTAKQALYRPADKIAWDQAKRQLAIAQAQLAAARQDLIVRLAQAYFDVLAAQDTLHYLDTLKDSVGQQLAMAQRNFEIGNANITDTREAQARLALTSAQQIATQNDLHVKQLALQQLAGQAEVQPRPLAEPVHLPGPNPQNPGAWAARVASAPAVQQARLALDVARLEAAKAKTGNWPSLDLQAGIARAQYPGGNPMGSIAAFTGYEVTQATIGVQLTWPVIAGGAVHARERETLALKDKAQAEFDNALRGSTQAVRAAYFNLQSGLEQVKALEASADASRTALQANQIGYRVGARSNIDVLNAQSELFHTQRDLARARYDALVGLLRLKQAAGVLMPDDLTQIDNLLAP